MRIDQARPTDFEYLEVYFEYTASYDFCKMLYKFLNINYKLPVAKNHVLRFEVQNTIFSFYSTPDSHLVMFRLCLTKYKTSKHKIKIIELLEDLDLDWVP